LILTEKKKTGVLTIKASIAIWTNDSKNISQDALNRAAGEIKKSIEGAWNGTYQQDGITYTVKTAITVQAYDSEKAAAGSGGTRSGSGLRFCDSGVGILTLWSCKDVYPSKVMPAG
jgi:hypothetical protein